jgi:integrase
MIDQADIRCGRHYLWDGELRGFGVQVEASGSKTYFVRYRPKGHGRSGIRRFYKIGRHGELTPDEARERAKRVLGSVADGADPAAELSAGRAAYVEHRDAITVHRLGEIFFAEHITMKRRASTARLCAILLRRHVFPNIGNNPAEALTRAVVAKMHAGMAATPPNANRVLGVVSSMYSFAAKRGLVPEGFNPARGIEKYREQGRERYLTSDELQHLGLALVDAETIGIPWEVDLSDPKSKHTPKIWKGQRDLLDPYAVAAVRLLLFTGARLREVLNLKWEHVDLERGLLFLPDSKTGKKTIILNAASSAILVRLMALANGEGHRPAGGFVIRGDIDGKPRSDLKRPWAAVRRHAGLDGVRLHDLRHTFASIGAGASLGLPVVGRLLGHSQPQTTARYAHLDADPLRRAADIIGDRITAAMALRPIPGKAAGAAE